ncbi:uncharacterized protein LOC111094466 isoform X3 [Canis lupus familiaris]|uniref:uncharacterized protein LOC111094466 isoform X3 n=1 Tax=Canis lupus familiaris TaxID=9615 RepID=UPI0018F49174|nr:uncharacterized protein LOC111094466 isoform X3 [Canis lupus familiaris]
MLCGAQGRCGGAWSPRCRIPEVISAFRGHTCSLSLPGSHSHGAQACRCLLSAEAGSGSGQIQKASEPTEDLPAPASPSCLQRVPWLLCHQRVGLAGIVPCLCSAPSRLPASGAPGESRCPVHQKHVPQHLALHQHEHQSQQRSLCPRTPRNASLQVQQSRVVPTPSIAKISTALVYYLGVCTVNTTASHA